MFLLSLFSPNRWVVINRKFKLRIQSKSIIYCTVIDISIPVIFPLFSATFS